MTESGPEWRVMLDGHVFDLSEFPVWLAGADVVVVRSGDSFYLTGSRFDGYEHSSDVLRAGREIVDLLNALGRLQDPGFEPITVSGTVQRIWPDGRQDAQALLSGAVRARSKVGAVVISVDGHASEPPSGQLTALLGIAETKELARRALGFLGRAELTWNDLYRAMEVVQLDVGGEMVRLGWISDRQLTRFKGTANSYSVLGIDARHGRDRRSPPPDPMSFDEAKRAISQLVLRWLEDSQK